MDDGGPQTLRELLAAPGVREQVQLRSSFGFMAIHGGELEQQTDVIARAAADLAAASYYVVSHPDGHDAHLASIRYRTEESTALAEFVDHVEVVVSVHGYGRRDRWTTLLLGGSNRRWRGCSAPNWRPGSTATRSSPTSSTSRVNCAGCTQRIR